MVKQDEIYKCKLCGNIISVIHAGSGTLSCCNSEMILLEENSKEQEGKEKHVPIIGIKKNKINVKVGEVEHPMEESHYIGFIQIVKEGKVIGCKRLYPGEKPEAEFTVENTEGITARELCNIHGLWTS
tara:strand:+ start:832 stop:1215 length:384 start_codon:yes stop_codon:yes gene_type:complete